MWYIFTLTLGYFVGDDIQSLVDLINIRDSRHQRLPMLSNRLASVYSLTCIESALITSPWRAFESSMPSWDFPTPVVPITAIVDLVGWNIANCRIHSCTRCSERISCRDRFWTVALLLWQPNFTDGKFLLFFLKRAFLVLTSTARNAMCLIKGTSRVYADFEFFFWFSSFQ